MRAAPGIDRRRLLQLAATTARAGNLPRASWSQPRWRDDPFVLGVASGDDCRARYTLHRSEPAVADALSPLRPAPRFGVERGQPRVEFA